jgi:hypothetical protein
VRARKPFALEAEERTEIERYGSQRVDDPALRVVAGKEPAQRDCGMVPPRYSNNCLREGFDMDQSEDKTAHKQSQKALEIQDSAPPEESNDSELGMNQLQNLDSSPPKHFDVRSQEDTRQLLSLGDFWGQWDSIGIGQVGNDHFQESGTPLLGNAVIK